MPSHSMHASTMNDECLDDEMKMTGRRLVVEPAPMQGYEANFASISRNWKISCQGLPWRQWTMHSQPAATFNGSPSVSWESATFGRLPCAWMTSFLALLSKCCKPWQATGVYPANRERSVGKMQDAGPLRWPPCSQIHLDNLKRRHRRHPEITT